MNIPLIIFSFITATILALFEIQIEGPHGWAEKLPTWILKNPFNKVANWPHLTGYHIYMWLFILTISQSPFVFGLPFSLKQELIMIQTWFFILALEDFMWFVLNPAWGVKKFFNSHVPWHQGKILFFPKNYWVSAAILIALEIFKRSLI